MMLLRLRYYAAANAFICFHGNVAHASKRFTYAEQKLKCGTAAFAASSSRQRQRHLAIYATLARCHVCPRPPPEAPLCSSRFTPSVCVYAHLLQASASMNESPTVIAEEVFFFFSNWQGNIPLYCQTTVFYGLGQTHARVHSVQRWCGWRAWRPRAMSRLILLPL